MGVTYFLLLSCLGFAITVQAQDCSQPVPGPNMSLRDEYINQQSFPSGSVVSFSCNVGYQTAGGSAAITCTSGTWSTIRLNCERKSCGAVEVENGQVEYIGGSDFGDKAVITCNTGYILVGKNELTCYDQGWSTRPPVCEVVTCEPPPQIVDGNFRPDNEVYTYRDAVQYRCKDGYTLLGPKSRTCSEDGTFTPDAPTCALIHCEDPPVANADWVRNPPYKPGSTVTFQCRSGYTLKGQEIQTCDKSGQWSPGLPTCERITTTTTTTTTTSTTTKKPTDERDDDDESQPSSGVVVRVVVGVIVGTITLVTGIIVYKKMKNKKNQGFRRGTPGDAKDGDQMEEM